MIRAHEATRPAPAAVSGAPGAAELIVLWRATEHCSLACGFCAYDRRRPITRRKADLALVRRLGAGLREWSRAQDFRVLVSWLGGEPLHWPALFDATDFLRHACGFRVSLTTSGILLDRPQVRRRLLDLFDEITVSVDAIGGIHDRLRGWPGGFECVRRGTRALVRESWETRRRPLFRVNAVLMRDNIGGFDRLCREVANWGVDEITFNELGGRDRPAFHRRHRLRPKDVEQLARDIGVRRRALAERGVRLCGGPAYFQRLRASAAGIRLPMFGCPAGRDFLFVDVDGHLAPCHATITELGVEPGVVGTAADWAALSDRWIQRRRQRPPAACNDCRSTRVYGKFEVASG